MGTQLVGALVMFLPLIVLWLWGRPETSMLNKWLLAVAFCAPSAAMLYCFGWIDLTDLWMVAGVVNPSWMVVTFEVVRVFVASALARRTSLWVGVGMGIGAAASNVLGSGVGWQTVAELGGIVLCVWLFSVGKTTPNAS